MEGLDAGEDVVGSSKTLAHDVGHGYLAECGVESFGMCADELLNLRFCQDLDAELRPFLRIERAHHGVEELFFFDVSFRLSEWLGCHVKMSLLQSESGSINNLYESLVSFAMERFA